MIYGIAKCMIQTLVITAPSSMQAKIKPTTLRVIQSPDFTGTRVVLLPFTLPFDGGALRFGPWKR